MIDMAELGVVLAETSKINQGHYLYNWSGIFEDRSVIDIEKVYIRNVGAVDIPVSPEVLHGITTFVFQMTTSELLYPVHFSY